ncbi:hypothetical protein KJ652_01635 [Patescibacteria group bacterium]|nr:hypothetical protein [Patescibacteria group bacterium]MBU1123269.1 hypothetical protein [Patescibacteria group bacterium]
MNGPVETSRGYRRLIRDVDENGHTDAPASFFVNLSKLESPNEFEWLIEHIGIDKLIEWVKKEPIWADLRKPLRTTRELLLKSLANEDESASNTLLSNHAIYLDALIQSDNGMHEGSMAFWNSAFWIALDRNRVNEACEVTEVSEVDVNRSICRRILAMRGGTGDSLKELLEASDIHQDVYDNAAEVVASEHVQPIISDEEG